MPHQNRKLPNMFHVKFLLIQKMESRNCNFCVFLFTMDDLLIFRNADAWPPKLIMQIMPKQLIGSIGGAYLKNSKSVFFTLQNCEALESLTKVMNSGFVSYCSYGYLFALLSFQILGWLCTLYKCEYSTL